MSKKVTKIAVISVTEDSKIYLNYWERGHKPIKNEIKHLCSKLRAAMSLEVSSDERYLYIGGCSRLNVEKGFPIISVVSFDRKMTEVCSLRLSDDSMKNIFQMKRIPGSEVLVLSGFNLLSLVEFRESKGKLSELKQLRDLHDGEIFDFVLKGREIFSVSGRNNYIHKF